MTLRIAVLISGRGSNLRSIQGAIDDGLCDARIVSVISDRASAAGLQFAAERGLPTSVVSMRDHADRSAWDVALTHKVAELDPELVVLAGFMRVVGAPLLQRFVRRIINVHPALLPLFPGTNGPEQALAAGVRVSGCTVHIVDAGVDTGPIIAQGVVRVLPTDTVEALHERIQHAEHGLLPRVVDGISRGAITLDPEVRVPGAIDDGSVMFAPLLRTGRS
ncbi:MAG TPA: phosphoribosylglycinamide formyltransferase [Polyangiales bacterium]